MLCVQAQQILEIEINELFFPAAILGMGIHLIASSVLNIWAHYQYIYIPPVVPLHFNIINLWHWAICIITYQINFYQFFFCLPNYPLWLQSASGKYVLYALCFNLLSLTPQKQLFESTIPSITWQLFNQSSSKRWLYLIFTTEQFHRFLRHVSTGLYEGLRNS